MPPEIQEGQDTKDLFAGAGAAAPETASAPAAAETGAESPAAEAKAPEPKTALEAVTQAMKKEREQAEAKANPAEAEKPKEGTEQGEKAKTDDDPYQMPAGLKADSQKRFQMLANEAKTARTELEAATPKAKNWDDMVRWVKESNVTQQDVGTGLELMRLVRNDPHKALEAIGPIVEHLRKVTGDVLPEDLQAEVDAGRASEDIARELAKTRSKTTLLTERQQAEAADREAAESQRQHTEFVNGIAQAVSVWEKGWKESDPDYAKKSRMVKSRVVELIQTEGAPKNVTEAVAQAKKAREQIEEEMRGILPARKEVKPVTGGGSGRTVAAPSSSLEAAQMAIRGEKPVYAAA